MGAVFCDEAAVFAAIVIRGCADILRLNGGVGPFALGRSSIALVALTNADCMIRRRRARDREPLRTVAVLAGVICFAVRAGGADAEIRPRCAGAGGAGTAVFNGQVCA